MNASIAGINFAASIVVLILAIRTYQRWFATANRRRTDAWAAGIQIDQGTLDPGQIKSACHKAYAELAPSALQFGSLAGAAVVAEYVGEAAISMGHAEIGVVFRGGAAFFAAGLAAGILGWIAGFVWPVGIYRVSPRPATSRETKIIERLAIFDPFASGYLQKLSGAGRTLTNVEFQLVGLHAKAGMVQQGVQDDVAQFLSTGDLASAKRALSRSKKNWGPAAAVVASLEAI